MEEDIKIIEKIIAEYVCYYLKEEEVEALENLLKAYKELEEENIQWRGKYHLLSRKINVVPLSKIKEKIEELEEEKKCFYSDYAIEERNDKIQVLKELLEEE